MPRFFIQKDCIIENEIIIKNDDAFHIARSLRMAVGDEIEVCDDEGVEYSCRLTYIRDELCRCEILESRKAVSEPSVKATLYMAYPKGDKLETVIQKAVELGVFKIVPFESSRCIKRPREDKIEKQTARLERIAGEAAKQCRRGIVPEVTKPISYSEMLTDATKSDLALLCYEAEDGKNIKNAISGQSFSSISIIVGAEGGFSPEEARAATEAGCISVSLGPRILRCETAPLYALSALSYELEL